MNNSFQIFIAIRSFIVFHFSSLEMFQRSLERKSSHNDQCARRSAQAAPRKRHRSNSTRTGSLLFHDFFVESLLLLPSIECGRIGVEDTEVIAPFLVYSHLCQALPFIKSGEIDFDSERKIADIKHFTSLLRVSYPAP
jgi:hypothetical protein